MSTARGDTPLLLPSRFFHLILSFLALFVCFATLFAFVCFSFLRLLFPSLFCGSLLRRLFDLRFSRPPHPPLSSPRLLPLSCSY